MTEVPAPGRGRRWGRISLLLRLAATGSVLALVASGLAAAQTGTLSGVRKGGRAKVVWNTAADVAPGRIGVVLDEGFAVALIRVTQTGAKSSRVEVLDLLGAESLRKGEEVRLGEAAPTDPAEGLSTLLVWSGSVGSPLRLDGKEAGRTPALLRLSAGPHEILLRAADGGTLGAVIDLSGEKEKTLFLNGRHPPGSDPERRGRPHRWDSRPPSATRPRDDAPPFLTLEWIEEPRGGRVYLPCTAIRPPSRVVAEAADSSPARVQPDPGSRVILEGVIGPNGQWEDLRVIASRRPELADRALQVVGNWTYNAALLAGEPVPALATLILGAFSPASSSGE